MPDQKTSTHPASGPWKFLDAAGVPHSTVEGEMVHKAFAGRRETCPDIASKVMKRLSRFLALSFLLAMQPKSDTAGWSCHSHESGEGHLGLFDSALVTLAGRQFGCCHDRPSEEVSRTILCDAEYILETSIRRGGDKQENVLRVFDSLAAAVPGHSSVF